MAFIMINRSMLINRTWQKSAAIRIQEEVRPINRQRLHCISSSGISLASPKRHSPSTLFDSNARIVQPSSFPSSERLLNVDQFNRNRSNIDGEILSNLEEQGISAKDNLYFQDFIKALDSNDSDQIWDSLKLFIVDLQSRRFGVPIQTILNDERFASPFTRARAVDMWLIFQILEARKHSTTLKSTKPIYHAILFRSKFAEDLRLIEVIENRLQEDGRRLSAFERALILQARFCNKVFKDYWEALDDYRYLRDLPLPYKSPYPFKAKEMGRLLFFLVNAKVVDPDTDPFLPIEIALEMLTDLQEYPAESFDMPVVQQYLLDHYARSGRRIRNSKDNLKGLSEIQQIILGIHQAMIEEQGENLRYDTSNFSSLLNAYSLTYMFEEAMSVWNKIEILNLELNPVDVSVIFDACGFAGRLTDARNIFSRIEQGQDYLYLMEKNVWDSWLECLARCGALREAIHIAFNVMKPALEERRKMNFNKQAARETRRNRSMRVEKRDGNDESFAPNSLSSDVLASNRLRELDSEGRSDSRPDWKTFRMLFTFALSYVTRPDIKQADKTIVPELLRQIQTFYPDLLPFLENERVKDPKWYDELSSRAKYYQ